MSIPLRVTPDLSIDSGEIVEEFVRASGPGGQHVNKTSTAVQLRFDALHSPSLPDDVKRRLIHLAGSLMTAEGVIIIDARQFRSQKMNREDARERLINLIRSATIKPKPRHKTRPTLASKVKRLEEKKSRSAVKQLRSRKTSVD